MPKWKTSKWQYQEPYENKWNHSPLHKNQHTIQWTLIFDTDEYPVLTKSNPNCTKTGESKPQTDMSTPKPNASLMAQEIGNQILKDMKEDFTKMLNTEINILHSKLTTNLDNLKTDLQQDLNSQITKVLKTIQILNQCFTEVMDHLPPKQLPCLPTKNQKGWAWTIKCTYASQLKSISHGMTLTTLFVPWWYKQYIIHSLLVHSQQPKPTTSQHSKPVLTSTPSTTMTHHHQLNPVMATNTHQHQPCLHHNQTCYAQQSHLHAIS